MNKAELINHVAANADLSKTAASAAVEVASAKPVIRPARWIFMRWRLSSWLSRSGIAA